MKLIKCVSILSIVFILMFAFCNIKSFAVNNLTLTVSGDVKGRTLSLYKLFNLESDEESNYYYTWDNLASEKFFSSKKITTLFDALEYMKDMESDSTNLTNLAIEYYNFCTDSKNAKLIEGKMAKIGEKTAGDKDTKIVFSGLDEGYYLVYDETENVANTETKARSAAILSSLTKNDEVKIKTDAINVKKEANVSTANVGDNIDFTITTSVPRMVGYDEYEFNVEDVLSKGLEFNNDIVVKVANKEYSKIKLENGTEQDAYTVIVNTNEDGTTALKIKFNNFITLKNKANQKIEITYSAKLNSEAAIEKDNTNQVKLIYSNDPISSGKGESNIDVVHVYSFKLNIVKKNSKNQALNDAQFILKLENGKYATFDSNTGIFTGEVEKEKDATILTSSGTMTGDNGEEVALGKIVVSGLKEGNYTLKEIKAPEGYNKPNFEFSFKITPTLNDGILEGADFENTTKTNAAKGYLSGIQKENGVAEFNIEVLNAQKGTLPSTGGTGTIIFTIIGITAMLSAILALVIINRKKLVQN